MTILRELKRRQRAWAASKNIPFDRNGYVPEEAQNFLLPLSQRFSKSLDSAGGGERQRQRHLPAKIRALHSSSALAINVFQYWEDKRGPGLPRAIGLEGELADVSIERQFPTGLRGTPPTLDVLLEMDDHCIVAIESKFTEWIERKRPDLDRFRRKYLNTGRELWADAGLPNCQALAFEVADHKIQFRQLDVLQLLKHALGLGISAKRPFSLMYLYYDHDRTSDIADLHREEVGRFAGRVDDRLNFRAMSYQSLFAALAGAPLIDPGYIAYLKERYP